jgi:predicted PurR-regulated permease PerM
MRAAFAAVWANPYARLLLTAVGLVLAYLLLRATVMVWSTLLIAFLFAYLLNPLVNRIERRGVHRGGGVAVAALIFFGILLGLYALGTTVAAQFSLVADRLPLLIEALEGIPFQLARFIDPAYGAVFEQVFLTTHLVAGGIAGEVLPSVATVGAGGLTAVLAAVTNVGIQVVLVIVVSLYLLYRYPVYGASLLTAVPMRHRPFMADLARKADESVGGYVRGQILISMVVGALTGIGLSLLGVPLAAALAVVVAVFNVIPFFGPIVASVPTILMALTVGLTPALGALVVLVAVNQVDAHLLTPIIYSRTISLDPVTIVASILTGLVLFGLVGALVAVPIAAFVKLLYVDYYLTSRWYGAATKGALSDP